METNKTDAHGDARRARRLSLILGFIFLVAGATKFLGASLWFGEFDRFQFPSWWFMYAVGFVETLGGLLLLFGRFPVVVARILTVLMLGAVLTHLRVGEFLLAPIPLLLLILLLPLAKPFKIAP